VAGAALVRLAGDALEGKLRTPADVARSIVGIGLTLVPHTELQAYLTEAGIERGEIMADIAEVAKFSPFKDPLDEDETP
jgi:hypothetical protein